MAKTWFRFRRLQQPSTDVTTPSAGSAVALTEPDALQSEQATKQADDQSADMPADPGAEAPAAMLVADVAPPSGDVAELAEAGARDCHNPTMPEEESVEVVPMMESDNASDKTPIDHPAAGETLGDIAADAPEQALAEVAAVGDVVASAAEGENVAEEPADAAAPSRLDLALGVAIPSYVDAQSAGAWLALLTQISAVTAYKTLSYDLLNLQSGERAVDVGCGLGADARELARRVGATGSVVGVDGSAEMIARATDATDATAARTLSFITADATSLPLETNSFDALRADRLLQHVEDPLQALVEFRRVLRPGARIVIIEPDWKTMAVYPGSVDGADDDTCVAAIFDWQVAHTRHPLIGRQLRMLLGLAGFASVTVTPVAYASTRFIEADLTLELSRAADGAAEQWPARLSKAEADAWRVTAQAADAAGHFFASVPLYFAHAIVE